MYATDWASQHTDHAVVVLLVTDGEPTTCTPKDINEIAAIAAVGLASTPRVSTFVVGLASVGEVDIANLDTIAKAGGTEHALLVDNTKNVTTQLLSAFESIRRAALSCELQVPIPTEGTLDYGKVNVLFVPGKGGPQQTLTYVGSAAHCDPVKGGWYYDVDPSMGIPTKIEICPATCGVFQTDTNGTVNIEVGCVTTQVP
jgi:hypothetical protein